MALVNLMRQDGEQTTPGVKGKAYVALCRSVITFPPVVGDSSPEDKVTLDGSIGFGQGEGFFECYTTREMAKLTGELAGQRDARSWAVKYEFFFPGTGPKAYGLINELKNSNTLWIIEDLDGNKFVLGSPDNPAEIEAASMDTGDKFDSGKGFKITVRATSDPVRYYNGVITLADV